MSLVRPVLPEDRPGCAVRLGDAAFWAPYVAAVLRRHGLPDARPRPPAPGSFPMFLAGAYVVTLFPARLAGGACY